MWNWHCRAKFTQLEVGKLSKSSRTQLENSLFVAVVAVVSVAVADLFTLIVLATMGFLNMTSQHLLYIYIYIDLEREKSPSCNQIAVQ